MHADAFLNNGGANGLQDFYLSLAPALPWKLTGKLAYHRFWSDDKHDYLGEEQDVVVSRPLTQHMSVLTKAAYFNGRTPGPADRWRFWLELTFKY